MPTPDIIERMRQLRSELAEAKPAAPEAAHVATALDSVLVDPTQAPRYAGLGARLRSALTALEGSHPQLAASIGAVINALSAAGI